MVDILSDEKAQTENFCLGSFNIVKNTFTDTHLIFLERYRLMQSHLSHFLLPVCSVDL